MANTNQSTYSKSAQEVFDSWALDYHASGMEKGHWPSVMEALNSISPQDGRYLEVGVGNGYAINHVAQNQFARGHCAGIDVSANMVATAQSRTLGVDNVEIQVADFLLYKPDSRFDVIFSMEVFYYLSDLQAGLDHAFKLLNPGGRLMVLVNHYLEYKESHRWPFS